MRTIVFCMLLAVSSAASGQDTIYVSAADAKADAKIEKIYRDLRVGLAGKDAKLQLRQADIPIARADSTVKAINAKPHVCWINCMPYGYVGGQYYSGTSVGYQQQGPPGTSPIPFYSSSGPAGYTSGARYVPPQQGPPGTSPIPFYSTPPGSSGGYTGGKQ